MAKLLLIKKETERPGINEIGDIVGIFDDKHVFSSAEESGFDIVSLSSKTVSFVNGELSKLLPDTSALSEEELNTKVSRPKYLFKVKDKTKTIVADICECKVEVLP